MAVNIDDHFAKERILIKRYKRIFLLFVLVPAAVSLAFSIETLTRTEIDEVFSVVVVCIIACEKALIAFIFVFNLCRMQSELQIGYRDFLRIYTFRNTISGICCILSSGLQLFIAIYCLIKTIDEGLWRWIEFASFATPCISVVLTYPVYDVFEELNKFPEQITRVSLFQLIGKYSSEAP